MVGVIEGHIEDVEQEEEEEDENGNENNFDAVGAQPHPVEAEHGGAMPALQLVLMAPAGQPGANADAEMAHANALTDNEHDVRQLLAREREL